MTNQLTILVVLHPNASTTLSYSLSKPLLCHFKLIITLIKLFVACDTNSIFESLNINEHNGINSVFEFAWTKTKKAT